jgi:hypothetical protein
MKIGFFEKYNQDTKDKEFSITRVQMLLATLFDFFFIYQYFITEKNDVTVDSIFLCIVILLFAAMPKAMKDLTDVKDKIASKKD